MITSGSCYWPHVVSSIGIGNALVSVIMLALKWTLSVHEVSSVGLIHMFVIMCLNSWYIDYSCNKSKSEL